MLVICIGSMQRYKNGRKITKKHITKRYGEIEEDHFILLGLSSGLRILLVCHCYRKNEAIIRIISARKATKKEQKQYKENLP